MKVRGFICGVCVVVGLAGGVMAATPLDEAVRFEKAEAVWPAGFEDEMNTLFGFKTSFDLTPGAKPTLKLVAWYSYRVTLNGAFVAFGPARGPKGFFRADELDLAAAAKPGRNELMVEVTGYNVPNLYLMKQKPFLKAEVVADGRVIAASRAEGGAFTAVRRPRIQKVARYTYQRTFTESYSLPGVANPPNLTLAKQPEPAVIARRAPYPDYEFQPRLALVSRAEVRVDAARKVRRDRCLTLPGNAAWFGGFTLKELVFNVGDLARQLVYTNRTPATPTERAAPDWSLTAGQTALFDVGFDNTGFPGARVTVLKPGRLVMTFDEVLTEGAPRGADRYGDVHNIVTWDFTEPGEYAIDTFEPYTMRYLDFSVLSGEMRLAAPHFRAYKNPTAKRASFRSSDPVLTRIFEAASETFRQNAVDVFMDCPSRERAGWNCDAYFTAPVSTLLTGNEALERVFEENQALPPVFEALPQGMLPMCYPSDHPQGQFIPNWAMWFVLQTEEYLSRSGDRATIAALRPRLTALIAYLRTFRNADGLLEHLPSWVFVEWSRCNKLVQDVNYPSNMTWADVLDAMNRLYDLPDCAAEAARVRETVRRQSWTGTWFCDNAVRQKDGTLKLSGECTETCQYYAFFHRVATPETHPALWKTLLAEFGPSRYDPTDRRKLLRHPKIWPSNAFVGNYLRLKLLARAGLGQQILDETKGYFQYMADRTGTLWENDTTCASCNHGFASYAAVLLVRGVLGADVNLVTKTVTLRKTDAKIDFCEVSLPVGTETLTITRRRHADGTLDLSTQVPPTWRVDRSR